MSAESEYYDELLGKGPGDPDMGREYVGMQKASVQHITVLEPPRDFGDNDKSDPFNIDLE